jgi:putative DNA primase/helicase
MKAIEEVLARLGDRVASCRDGTYSARCPAHDDARPSLSITAGEDRVVLCCHAGCSIDQILQTLGMEKRQLFDEHYAGATTSTTALTVVAKKTLKKLHATREGAIKAAEWSEKRPAVTRWDYTVSGAIVATVLRFNDDSGGKEFRPVSLHDGGWAVGAPAGKWPLYHGDDLEADGTVYVCEGEKAADAARGIGLTAVTSAGGAKNAKKTNWTPLAGRGVVILPDNDDAGQLYAEEVRAALRKLTPPATVEIVQLPGLIEGGDIADLVEAAGDDDEQLLALRQLVESTPAQANAPAQLSIVQADVFVPIKDGAANVSRPETLNDIGLGRRIIAEAGGRLRYVIDRGIWVRWTGTHWEDDPSGMEPQRIAKSVARQLWAEMMARGPEQTGPALFKFVQGAASRRSIDAAVAMARSEPAIEARSSDFDVGPWLLNIANGILDLKSLTLRPHDPTALLTKVTAAAFDQSASAPKWKAFIDAVACGDTDLAAFLQRSFGLALSADQSEQRLWMHWGEGSNGKGTALSVLKKVMGTYAGPAPVEVLLAKRHEADRELGVAKLVGKRLAFAQEADDGARLSEATLKGLTGSDAMTARYLYQNNFEVQPTWHLHLAVNDKPTIKGTDHGIWRRVLLVPWRHTFDGPEKRERAEVKADLMTEASGILNWMLVGLTAWRDGGLQPPAAVIQATAGYRADSDSVRAWIDEVCVKEPEAMAGATDLFADYMNWCKRAGHRGVTQTKFGTTLDDLGHTRERAAAGPMRNKIVRIGLRLAFTADSDAHSAHS